METDSPRSRTLAVSTFPTPLSRTGLAGFRASGSPEKTSPGWRIRKGLRISRPANFIHFDVFLLPPFALCAAFQRSLVGRDSYDYSNGSVTMRLTACRSSRIPSVWYVLARVRYPIHPLQETHCPSSRPPKVPPDDGNIEQRGRYRHKRSFR